MSAAVGIIPGQLVS